MLTDNELRSPNIWEQLVLSKLHFRIKHRMTWGLINVLECSDLLTIL